MGLLRSTLVLLASSVWKAEMVRVIKGRVAIVGEDIYNTKSVSVPSIRVVHRRNVDSAPVHDVVIGYHNSSEGSQEYGIAVHET